ncbi:NAD(P)H-binding protein [Streptomyces pactum]|uniref:NAD(P)H-binding protein n=1 Tax=Streptomyces pactum TaxID=68249 RepID=A0ABS0NHP8_9ACTN|nr:NAD(P)H-binding protein [Streptomyces pactum]MBH5334715.1 NAD(P)H-binding protein [Streptomyces pactum]
MTNNGSISDTITGTTGTTGDTVLVLGGSGKTGRRVAALLAERGVPARTASRGGATRFDWLDATTWGPALDGVTAVYLVYLQDLGSARAPGHIEEFLRLAKERGVARVVLLSARDWPAARPVEDAVRASGLGWTILRPTWFAQNFSEDMFLPYLQAGELRLPTGDGREPFIDAADIAEVAVAALTDDRHHGESYDLSGPRPMSFGEAVAAIAGATGRDLRYTPVSHQEFRADLVAAGLTEADAGIVDGLLRTIEEGSSAYLSDCVRRVLGREPRDFGAFAARAAAEGAWRV